VLADLQREFARELFAGSPRLRVHRETTLGALCAALEATYPVCARLVGTEFFAAAARRFAHEVASRSPDLCDYGVELADWLAAFEPAKSLAYLPDVARLEWALHRARHAAPAESPDLARLRVDPELRLRAAPGTALLASPFPIDRIWQTNQPGFTGEVLVCLDEGGVELVVGREPGGAALWRVTREELDVLAALAAGRSLAEAAVSWLRTADSLGALLARAVQRGWLEA
jgi:hypothetical protein